MNKLANVVFAYSPKNDDELELKVGDKIEVIGYEEEGWWKGQLRGRVGVFPSNFVQVVDTPQNIQPTITSSSVSQAAATANKLNSIFGAKAASTKQPTSLSSTSLSSNNSTSCGALNNITNNTSNNNLTMNNNNNAPHRDSNAQPQQGLIGGANTTQDDVNFSERRPKPIKGIGYGDIFASGGAKLKPLPVDPGGSKVSTLVAGTTTGGRASERVGLSNPPIQKQIPKKPPPPTPTGTNDNLNGSSSTTSSSEQAPALPPKPSNQFSPHIHQSARPILPPVQQTPPHQHHINSLPHQALRERAKVLYAYDPLNDDELAMKVGDIIEIIDKDIEDAGWWKGELRGKIGVFPDNFVELIEPSDLPVGSRSEWQNQSIGSTPTIVPHSTSNSGYYNSNVEMTTSNKMKSVFAGTPKGFSKELESNLEKHGSTPASFLSLKRNKIHQQQTEDLDQQTETASEKSHDEGIGSLVSNTTRLNHITANRAKGPSRRPPSNILNKRNQFDSLKRELTNGNELNQLEKVSQGNNPNMQPIDQSMPPTIPSNLEPSLSSSQQQQHATPSSLLNKSIEKITSTGKPSSSAAALDDNVDNNESLSGSNVNQAQAGSMTGLPASSFTTATPNTPKTSQRFSQQQDKSTTSSSSTSTTPPWMVEWKKTHAEKKRDTPVIGDQHTADIDAATDTAGAIPTSANTSSTSTPAPQTNNQQSTIEFPQSDRKTSVHSLREAYNPTAKGMTSRYSIDSNTPTTESSPVNRFASKNVGPQEPTNNNSDQSPTNKPPTSMTRAGVLNKSTFQTSTIGSRDPETNGVLASAVAGNQQNNNASRFQSSRSMFDGISVEGNGSSNNQQQQTSSTATSTHRLNNGIKSSNAGDNLIDATLALKDELGSSIKLHYDKLFQQISDKVSNEVSELRSEIALLKKELDGMDELKRVVEVMKQELKACQSATDNQRKYIKELIGNLADERKKIAAMQVELDRNLK